MQKPRLFTSHDSSRAPRTWTAFVGLLILVLIGFLIVGGARDDLLSLLVWRPLSMMALTIAVALYWRDAWQNGRGLLLFALAIVGLVMLHLVPMPPAMWTALPGRDILVGIYRDAGMALPWQPLSVAQARTWNALFSLAAPLAVLIFVLSIEIHWRRKLLLVLLALGFTSGIVGLVQAIGPAHSPLYYYRITNNGLSVGLFANRNHQATFLAAMYPLIAANLSFFAGKPEELFFHRAMAIAAGLLLVPLILVTGSRGGVILALLGMLSAWWVYRPPVAKVRSAEKKTETRKRVIGFGLVSMLLMLAAFVAMRTPALQRLVETDPAGELRVIALPIILDASARFFPFGSGIGTFVEVYKIFEPNRLIASAYLNHAHNDFVELLLTAGVPGLLLLLWGGVLAALSLKSLISSRSLTYDQPGFQSQILGRAGFSIIAMLALYSVADYPLRVPSLMLFATIAAAWCSNAYLAARK